MRTPSVCISAWRPKLSCTTRTKSGLAGTNGADLSGLFDGMVRIVSPIVREVGSGGHCQVMEFTPPRVVRCSGVILTLSSPQRASQGQQPGIAQDSLRIMEKIAC